MVCLGSQFDDWSIMVEKVGQRELETVIPMASFERRERGEGQEGGGGRGRGAQLLFLVYSAQAPGPWDDAGHIQGGSFFLRQTSPETF